MRRRFLSHRVIPCLPIVAAILFGGFLFIIPPAHASAVPLSETYLASDPYLTAYYPFEGNQNDYGTSTMYGTALTTSTIFSSTTPSSAFGDSLNFNGFNSSAQEEVNSGIVGSDGFTINAWIYSATTTISPQDIASLGTENTYNDGGAFIIDYPNPNQIGYFIAGGAGHIVTNDGAGALPNLNQWYMVTMTYPGGAGIGSTTIYVDGQEDPNVSISGSSDVPTLSNSPVDMGRELTQSSGVWPLLGNLDDVSLFSRVLSPTEVSNLYNGLYYAQIQNGTDRNVHSGTSTADSIIKTLPAGWIIQVVTTTDSLGDSIVDGSGNTWFGIVDPTDGTSGWMVASDTTTSYITPYDGSDQSIFETSSTEQIATGTTDQANFVLKAIDNYYNNNSTSSSLYNSDDGGNTISDLENGGYPEEVIPGIAVVEDDKYLDGYPLSLDNQNVSEDYGGGIMEVTFSPGNWDHRGIASGVTIPLCAAVTTTSYENCYSAISSTTDLRYYQPYGGVSGSPEYIQYTNTPQSIYANIKDGLQVLANSYDAYSGITTSTAYASTTFSAADRQVIAGTESYNGDDCGYVGNVANALDDITGYFPNATTSGITNLISEMHTVSDDDICGQIHSPATLTIQDSTGRTVGVANGKGENDFPFGVYDPNGKWAKILAASNDNYTFKVNGIGTGTYTFDFTIKLGSQEINFAAAHMPVIPHQIDTYSVDPNAILSGQNGITLQVDTEGDGIIDKTEQLSGAVVTNLSNQTPTPPQLRSVVVTPKIEPIIVPLESDYSSTGEMNSTSSINIP